VNQQVPDSASTATAYLGGVKTNNYMLGLTGAATRGNCISSKGSEKIVTSVLEEAWKEGNEVFLGVHFFNSIAAVAKEAKRS